MARRRAAQFGQQVTTEAAEESPVEDLGFEVESTDGEQEALREFDERLQADDPVPEAMPEKVADTLLPGLPPGGSSGAPPGVNVGAMGMNLGMPQATAGGPARAPALARKFRVINGGRVSFGGHVTVLRAGKLVDEMAYSIADLRDQGIVLEEVAELATA